MFQRQKWKEDEDKKLEELVGRAKTPLDWHIISKQLAALGVKKSPRQVRERWSNHLDPNLERDSLSSADNRRLFKLHEEIGNSWKEIASKFPGRSDNGIKNQFFAMIRKALRKARKALKQSYNTAQVNQIKPKMLAKFLTIDLDVPANVGVSDPNFPWAAKGKLKVKEFLLYFLNTKFSQIERDLTEQISTLIQFVLDELDKENDKYCKTNQIFTRRKKKAEEKTAEPMLRRKTTEEKKLALNRELSKNSLVRREPSPANEIRFLQMANDESRLINEDNYSAPKFKFRRQMSDVYISPDRLKDRNAFPELPKFFAKGESPSKAISPEAYGKKRTIDGIPMPEPKTLSRQNSKEVLNLGKISRQNSLDRTADLKSKLYLDALRERQGESYVAQKDLKGSFVSGRPVNDSYFSKNSFK